MDAWTPTFPSVEYDINNNVFYKAREKFKALKGRIPSYLYEEALRVNNNGTGNVRYSGMDSFVHQMEQNYGIRAAYVASKGIQSDDNAKRTEVGKYDDSEAKTFEAERNTLNKIDVTGEELREIVAALAEKRASKVRKMILDELDTAIENAQNATVDENVKSSASYSLTNKDDYAIFLYQNNDEQKRYERLRDTSIKIENANNENYSPLTKGQLSSIVNARSLKEIENIFKNYCGKIKIWGTQFRSPELDFEYGFSVGALHESVHKQSLIKTGSEENNKFLALAKAIASANSITSNAKLLEMHTDQDYAKSIEPNHKVNSNIKYTYELISGYIDGENIVPVKITVKEYLDRANTPNMIYVLESLPAINKDSITMKAIPDMNQGRRDTPLSDNYSLADILSVIKNSAADDERLDKAVGRYIPDQFANTTKSLTENIPTKAKFSIDVDQPVQQTKDLIAVHNLDEGKLLADINELGGFPAPSIAIIRQGHDGKDYFYDIAKIRRTTPFHATDFSSHAGQRSSSNSKLTYNSENARANSEIPEVRRFSLDVDHPVQQTKDLIAVHNLDEEKLLADINELGGFPAPSMVYSLV